MNTPAHPVSRTSETDSSAAWFRLGIALLAGTIGSVGMWSVVVALPAVQADFGVLRADASLPFTFAMIGFGLGGMILGRLADRFGIVVPVIIGAACIGPATSPRVYTANIWQLALAYALIGFGSSATFGPLVADISHWFVIRRGIAVAVAASGNYAAGAVWPPIVQYFIQTSGWRPTHIGIGIFCVVTMLPLSLLLLKRVSQHGDAAAGAAAAGALDRLGLSANTLLALLGDRRGRVLRGDVDAAGAYRRLLRRSRLWRGARRGNALAHARDSASSAASPRASSPTGSAA